MMSTAATVVAASAAPGWVEDGLALLACGVFCLLGVASLFAIGWLGWTLSDQRRADDYRARTESAMHRGTGEHSDWLAAVRAEAAYAVGYVHDHLRSHHPR